MELIIFVIAIFVVFFFFLALSDENNGNKKSSRSNHNRVNDVSEASNNNTVTFTLSVDEKDPRRSSNTKSNSDPDKCWVPKGKTIRIQGYEISGGLIYYGNSLSSINSSYNEEPALINPELPVDTENPDFDGVSMGYWPSYFSMNASARAGYLDWLASDRSNPSAYIGYVFLYYYGLERRLLNDFKNSSKAKEERGILIGEINRLYSIYKVNSSFNRYAGNLINYLQVTENGGESLVTNAHRNEDLDYANYLSSYHTYPINNSLELALSTFTSQKKPLPHRWALKLTYQLTRSYSSVRTPATRCTDIFPKLFKKEYRNKYGKGLILDGESQKFSIQYNTASHSFGYGNFEKVTDIKVPQISKHQKELISLFQLCTDKIDPYSRYLGRNPNSENSLEAISNLPGYLVEDKLNQDLKEFIESLKERIQKEQFALIDTEEFTNFWDIEGVNKYKKNESIEIAQFLFKLGIGIEPDLRFGSAKFERESQVVIFDLDPHKFPKSPSKEYKIALIILHLTTTLGLADGNFSPEEEEHLDNYIETLFQLSNEEKKRLEAYLFWLKKQNPGVAGIKRRIGNIEQEKKDSILHFLIKVANADGYVDPQEIDMLQKIATILELDPEKVYTEVHAHQTSEEDPVLIIKGEQKHGHKIPSNKEEKSHHLDSEQIQNTLKETDEVQSILSSIFAEDDHTSEENQEKPKENNKQNNLLDLDSAHSELLNLVIAKNEFERSEYEFLCEELGLFPNGALEHINEKSYEHFDDLLLFDEENIIVNENIAKELKQ